MAARPRRASALACVCVAACLRATLAQVVIAGVEPPPTGEAGETMSFFATSDWGGQAAAPYTTPLQLQMAASMGHVSASFHPHFVVSAGGNFLPGGLPGTGLGNTNDQIRVSATFNSVFSPDSLQVPWYIAGGTPDWEGNLTAEISFNGSSFTNGRWVFPARYHTFTTVVPGGGDTVQIIMIDTESLIGGVNRVPIDMPPLYYPPPAVRRSSARKLAAAGGPASAPAAALTAAPTAAPAATVPIATTTVPAATVTAAAAAAPAAAVAAVTTPAAAAVTTPAATVAAASPVWSLPPVATYSGAQPAVTATYSTPSAYAAKSYVPTATPGTVAQGSSSPAAAAGGANAQEAAQEALAAANAAEVFAPPTVDEAQWNWLEGQLNSSTADWIIIVGYHPVWSVGAYGPTWTLVTRLIPMMQQAGVALYIGGTDHLLQHFTPVPQWQNVDYIVVGNGAYASPPGTTAAEAMPHAMDCPDGGLQFSFGETTGFAVVELTSAGTHQPSELHVNFFDANQTMLYSFFKENPRTMPGHIAGDLRSPPSPGRSPAGAGVSYDTKPLAFMGGAFLVVAVLLCLVGAASHARRQLMYLSAMRGARTGGPGMGADMGAAVAPEAGETTPLMLQRGRAYAPPAARPMPQRKFVA